MPRNLKSSARALWSSVTHIDKSKVNSRWLAGRNALAVAIPLAIGIAIRNPLGGVALSTGALNVCYSDGVDPYAQRGRRMLLWSFLGAIAVFIGSATGQYHFPAILFAAMWAFVAGLLVAVSTRAGDLGLNTLVTLIVFAAKGAMSPKGAFYAALLVLAGGLLQTFFALVFWPLHRHRPELRVIGKVYSDLSHELDPNSPDFGSAPIGAISTQLQETLSALGRDHSVESERFRLLFDQVDRLRLSVYAISRLRSELNHSARRGPSSNHDAATHLDQVLRVSSDLLASVGECLRSAQCGAQQPSLMNELQNLVARSQSEKAIPELPLAREIAASVDVLAGQLRVVVDLAAHATEPGGKRFILTELAQPIRLQLSNWLPTLRANLGFRSSAFRHAVRLSVCVAAGDAIGRSISWQRSYWLPMTIAVVLKPDFTTTFSRGILRLAGTLGGLVVATVLYHLLPASALTQLLLIGVYTFFLRYVGPANYGVFSVAISGLIVFLIAATGTPPGDVVVQRALNTTAGGIFALIAYALWPTWERTNVSEVIAEMIDASRVYFHNVFERFSREDEALAAALDQSRDDWRRARSNAEASVDRASSEPVVLARSIELLHSMLASSHVFIHSVVGLEAGATRMSIQTPKEAFQAFARDVELTLYFLSAALRGSRSAGQDLPQIREDHRRLVESRDRFSPADEFIIIETDRLTVSLNTLREQVFRYLGNGSSAPP